MKEKANKVVHELYLVASAMKFLSGAFYCMEDGVDPEGAAGAGYMAELLGDRIQDIAAEQWAEAGPDPEYEGPEMFTGSAEARTEEDAPPP